MTGIPRLPAFRAALQNNQSRLATNTTFTSRSSSRNQRQAQKIFFNPVEWWSKDIAPTIERAIDSVPYLGPSRLPTTGSNGKLRMATAAPLTRGGTRLKPNWSGDASHDLLKNLTREGAPTTLYKLGQGTSASWSKDIAPNIERAIDSVPYLGPSRLPTTDSNGKLRMTTAKPLTGGGTRLKPNWKNDTGHRVLKGAAIDFPKQTIEYLTAAPAAVAWAAGETLKNPKKAAGEVVHGGQLLGEGMKSAAEEDPYRFAGAMGAGIFTGGKTSAIKRRALNSLSPFYENVAVYKGKPSLKEGITGEQPFGTRQPTRTATTKKLTNSKLTKNSHDYYHGTSKDFVKEIQSKGSLKVASNNPRARAEFLKNKAQANAGKTVGKSTAAESALFLGAPETAYNSFISGGLLRIRGKTIEMSPRTVTLAAIRESLESAGKKVPKALDRDLTNSAFKDYFNAKRGDIIPGPKPLSGYKWVRRSAGGKEIGKYPEWEYVLQPGTKLYPKQSLRSKAYAKFGIKKGNKYTIDPETGEVIEILDLTTNPAESAALGKPLVDLEGVKTKIGTAAKNAKNKVTSGVGKSKKSGSKSSKSRSTKKGTKNTKVSQKTQKKTTSSSTKKGTKNTKVSQKTQKKTTSSSKKKGTKNTKTSQKTQKKTTAKKTRRPTASEIRERKIRNKKRAEGVKSAVRSATRIGATTTPSRSQSSQKTKGTSRTRTTSSRTTPSRVTSRAHTRRSTTSRSSKTKNMASSATIEDILSGFRPRSRAKSPRSIRGIRPSTVKIRTPSSSVSGTRARITRQNNRSATRKNPPRSPRNAAGRLSGRDNRDREDDRRRVLPLRGRDKRSHCDVRRSRARGDTSRTSNSYRTDRRSKGKGNQGNRYKKKQERRGPEEHEEVALFTSPAELLAFTFGVPAPVKPKTTRKSTKRVSKKKPTTRKATVKKTVPKKLKTSTKSKKSPRRGRAKAC